MMFIQSPNQCGVHVYRSLYLLSAGSRGLEQLGTIIITVVELTQCDHRFGWLNNTASVENINSSSGYIKLVRHKWMVMRRWGDAGCEIVRARWYWSHIMLGEESVSAEGVLKVTSLDLRSSDWLVLSQDELQSPGLWATEETGQAREGSGAWYTHNRQRWEGK